LAMLEAARSFIEAARLAARELCWSSEAIALVDIATPYLPESWVSMELVSEVAREVSRCTCLWILPGAMAGGEEEAARALPPELRGRVVELRSMGFASVSVRVYRRSVSVSVARAPVALAVTRPRTSPYPPLLGSVALAATYLTLPEHRWALFADPRAVDSAIARVFRAAVGRSLAVMDSSHVVACDGPIHGCVDRFLGAAALVGEPLSVDWILSRVARARCSYIDELARLGYSHPQLSGIGSALEAPRLKTHSLSRVLSKGVSGSARGAYQGAKRR